MSPILKGSVKLGTICGSSNPITGLPDLTSYFDFTDESKYTYSANPVVSSVSPVAGSINHTAVNAPEYTTNDGGALLMPTANDATFYDDDAPGGAGRTIGVAFKLPTFVSNAEVFMFASNAGAGNTSARLLNNASGSLNYRNNEAGSGEVIASGITQDVVFYIARYNSASSVDFYINNFATTYNLDPNDIYTSLPRFRLGARATAGVAGLEVFEQFDVDRAITDTEIQGVLNHWSGIY